MTRSLVAVSAGLSQPSTSRLLADRLARAASVRLDATVTDVELRALTRPIADATVTGFATGTLAEAIEAIRGADGVILVGPVFNAGYSGLFKSFVDVLEPGLLAGKPVALGATGGTPRHSLALEFAFRPLLAYLRAAVVPTAVFAAAADFGGDDLELGLRIEAAGAELADLILAGPRRAATHQLDPFADPVPFDRLLAG